MLKRIAPIFPVHDLDAAMAHYRRLGFATRTYSGDGYGYATRDGVELHLGMVSPQDRGASSAYLFVEDADAVAASWRSAARGHTVGRAAPAVMEGGGRRRAGCEVLGGELNSEEDVMLEAADEGCAGRGAGWRA